MKADLKISIEVIDRWRTWKEEWALYNPRCEQNTSVAERLKRGKRAYFYVSHGILDQWKDNMAEIMLYNLPLRSSRLRNSAGLI